MAQAVPHDSYHKIATDFYSYDSYNDDTFNLVVKDQVQTFAEFKSFDKLVFSTFGRKHKLFGSRLPKDTKIYLSTDGFRIFLHSLIEGVQENMRLGQCFSQYDATNVFATHSGKAKIKAKVFPSTSATRRQTYDCTWQFIISQHDDDAQIPEDIKHLINLIQNKQEKELLFSIHPSLLIEKARAWYFMAMYEYVMFKAKGDRDSILLKLPYLSEWRNIVYKCEVLLEAYEHPNADYLPLGDHKDGKPTTDLEKLIHEAEKFLDFIRNGIAHRLERKIVLSPADHQRILDAFFPLLSPLLQEAIYDVIGKERFQKVFLRKEQC